MTRLNTQFSVKGISLLNSVMASSSSVQFKKFLFSSLGVNTCGDMYDNQGLCSFQALRAKFCLPASAYFVFLQLRSALKAYGVPWSSSISSHPMRDWIAPSAGRPSVSLIYNKMIDCITNLFLLKLFGIGNYLILIYLSTGRECGLISA